VIVASDAWVFDRYLPAQAAVEFHWLGLLSSVLYGGIVEEVWLRLGVMTLMVWGLGLSLRRHFALDQLPAWVFWVAIGASALLFAAGHLPVTFALLCPASGDCTPLIVRALLLNGIGGLGFGYLYWRHGLIAAMVAHMLTHICMQVVFGPLLLG
jgi:membrane protease YdiL (CAAX protease family)